MKFTPTEAISRLISNKRFQFYRKTRMSGLRNCPRRGVKIESLENRTYFSTALNWKTVAPMLIPRSEGASFVADGKFFCFGGFSNATTLVISNEMDAYNPSTNTWTRMADCPVKVNDNPVTVDPVTDTAWCGGFFLNDGYHASGLMYAYHAATNIWTQGPSLPTNVGAGQMGVVGRELYYFGGRNSSNVGQVTTYKLDLDDPQATWMTVTPMLYTANHDGAAVIGGKIYAIGGIVDKQETTSNENHVQVFDPGTDRWTLAAPMPIGLGHIASAATLADGDILVCGGQVNGSGQVMSNKVLQYNPTADSWTELSNLPDYRTSDFVGYLDGKLIVTGGNMYSLPYINTTTWTADYSNSSSLPTLSVNNSSASQGSDVQFTVTLSTTASAPINASYSLNPGTASSADFNISGGTLSIPSGQSQTTIDVPSYGDESGTNESFTLTLAGLSSNAMFTNGASTESAVGTIMPPAVAPVPSVTSLMSSTASASVGGVVTLTATVNDAAGVPSGAVTFSNGLTTIGTATLDQTGTAIFTTTALPVGVDSISARYAGDARVAASFASATVIDVGMADAIDTITTLRSSADILINGGVNVFTISVTTQNNTAVGAGTVTLIGDGNIVGTSLLSSNGEATISLVASSLVASIASSKRFSAMYNGDSELAPSTSNEVDQSVLPASSASVAVGKSIIPTSAIAGQPLVLRVPITLANKGIGQKGTFSESVYLDTASAGLTGQAMLLATFKKKLNLNPSKSAHYPFSLRSLPASIAAGDYYLTILITDPSGSSTMTTLPQQVSISAARVSLSPIISHVSPITVIAGHLATISLVITNTGNVDVKGLLHLQLTAGNSGGSSINTVLSAKQLRVDIEPGASIHFRLRVRIPRSTSVGLLFLSAAISYKGVSWAANDGSPITVSYA